MARDIDFRRRPSRRQINEPAARPKRTRQRQPLFLATLILVLILGVAGLISSKKDQANNTNNSLAAPSQELLDSLSSQGPTAKPAQGSPTASTSNLFNHQTADFQIQLYSSGADKETTDKIIKRLQDKGYSVLYLGDSQFPYQTTDIWYRKEFESKAYEIGNQLTDRQVQYKESAIAGAFDLLIYLGKK